MLQGNAIGKSKKAYRQVDTSGKSRLQGKINVYRTRMYHSGLLAGCPDHLVASRCQIFGEPFNNLISRTAINILKSTIYLQ